MLKTRKDLEKVIQDFDQFSEFIHKFKEFIDTGKLAEFYCSKLFDLKLVKPHNSNIDALGPKGERIEIKHRFYSGKTPPGMKVNLDIIDYVFYVQLDENSLLPKEIFKIKSKDIEYKSDKRVSFRKAFKENKAELIYQS
ncbi:MAG: hypothetical protein QXZ43_01405 [Candidatus Aenigmatarchaeota archaeon]